MFYYTYYVTLKRESTGSKLSVEVKWPLQLCMEGVDNLMKSRYPGWVVSHSVPA